MWWQMNRSPKHLEFVRSLPCCVCLNPESVAAHIRIGTDGGMGLKPSDFYTVPLCHACHTKQHNKGERTFWGDIQQALNLAGDLFKCNRNEADGHLLVAKFCRKFNERRK